MKFLCDTREKPGHEWAPPKHREMVRVCLPFGDYSIDGFQTRVCVERKSLDDLVGSLFGGPRFLERLSEFRALDLACVVVEATEEDVRKAKYRPDLRSTRRLGAKAAWANKLDKLHPSTVFAAVAKAYAVFGVPFFLAGSPTRAACFAFSILTMWHEHERAKQA